MGTVAEFSSPVLMGWKDIANYLNMGIRTVQRYEREHELPIRRPAGARRGAVMATRAELDEWLLARPKRRLGVGDPERSPMAADDRNEIQAEISRMRDLLREMKGRTTEMAERRAEMSERRAEIMAVLGTLCGSIRVSETAPPSLPGTVGVGNIAAAERMNRIRSRAPSPLSAR